MIGTIMQNSLVYKSQIVFLADGISEYYSLIKKNGILPFATSWMDFEGIILTEISQRKTNTI